MFRVLSLICFITAPLLHAKSIWFEGTPSEAFVEAQSNHKPILLYWGATWCPPCNRLKSEVFSHPEFSTLTKEVVRVYLDGDTEGAQAWGEKLNAFSYPTILILNHNREEIMRVSSGLSWDEFKIAYQTAMFSKETFEENLKRALYQKSPPPEVWTYLAYAKWEHGKTNDKTKQELWIARQKLFEKIPKAYSTPRAVLAADILEGLTQHNKSTAAKTASVWMQVNNNLRAYLNAMFNGQESIWASRSTIIHESKNILQQAQKQLPPKEFNHLIVRWLQASNWLSRHPHASAATRMWAQYPSLVIYKLKNKTMPKSKPFKTAIRASVQQALMDGKSKYKRKSLLSGAAWLLQQVGEVDYARTLLKKELKTTDTPWYYQSALARLEENIGNREEALIWSKFAKRSSKGNASKLQWIVNDLLMSIRLEPAKLHRVANLLREYYDLALKLDDGFVGRNSFRANRIQKTIKANYPKSPFIRKTIGFYYERCLLKGKEGSELCRKHFSNFPYLKIANT